MVELKIFQMPVIKFNTLLVWALSTSSSILFVWWILCYSAIVLSLKSWFFEAIKHSKNGFRILFYLFCKSN